MDPVPSLFLPTASRRGPPAARSRIRLSPPSGRRCQAHRNSLGLTLHRATHYRVARKFSARDLLPPTISIPTPQIETPSGRRRIDDRQAGSRPVIKVGYIT